ncbi:DKNYY domain-containing protein [Candidatus Gottesmanbacteria bacterium]|nr:DKNYY domain-containing protein [Candidatus Gottesmanbacteria bacterium]
MKKIILLTLFSLVFFVGAILIILNRLNIKVPIPNSPYYKSFFGVYERECNNSLFIGVGCSPMYIKINNANPRTYQVLKYDSSDESEQYSYAKDDNNVFWYTEIIPEADLDTFKAVARGVAIDKNDVYLSGDIYNKYYFDQNGKELSESFDPNTFKILHRTNNHELLQDKSGIYYKRSNVSVPKAIKLEIADVESFKVESSDIYSAPPFPEKYAQYYIKNKFFSDDPYIIATDKNFVYIATNGGLDIVESLSPNTLFNKIAVGLSALLAVFVGQNWITKQEEKEKKIKEYAHKYPSGKFGIDWEIVEPQSLPGAYYVFEKKRF